jgi:hypothetical protein
MSDAKGILEKALYEGKAIELAPAACTDPDCGYVFQHMLDPETESWDEIPDYVECGRETREIPGESDPRYGENAPLLVDDPCSAPAKVFKDEAVLSQNDKTPGEIANEIYEREQRQGPGGPAGPRGPHL